MSDEKVVALATKRASGGPPSDKSAVAMLREVLRLAEEGKINSVAIAGTSPDDTTMTCFSDTTNAPLLIGGVAMLQHRLIAGSI